jgi:predicted RNA-binding Zn ribbon-like protein
MDQLWIDFVNSQAHDALGHGRDEDRLERPGWLEAFLERWSLASIDAGRPAVRQAFRELRDVIRACTARIAAGKPARAADIAALNGYLRAQPVVAQLQKDRGVFRMELVPVASGLDGVLSAIARSFAEFLCQGDAGRLKLCENPDCQWVFYDATRSRTRRWCADSCGNLMKVRRFRARRRS